MMRRGRPGALAAANGRFPANIDAAQGGRRTPVLEAVRQRRQGRRADAEHPADGERLVRPRRRVGEVDEGRRRHEGAASPSRPRPATSRTRSASHRSHVAWAPVTGRPARRLSAAVRRTRHRLSTHAPPNAPRAAGDRGVVGAGAARRRRSPGTVGLVGQDRPPRGRQRDRGLGGDGARRRREVGRARRARRPRRSRSTDLPARRGRAIPLKFLIPGTVFLIAFQVVPIVYNVNVALHELVDRPHPRQDRGDHGIQTQLALGAAGRRHAYVMAPARDEDGDLVLLLLDEATGKGYVGTKEGLEPLARARSSSDGRDRSSRRRGLRDRHGRRAARARPGARRASRCRPAGGAIRAEGTETALELAPTLRYDAASDTFTRIEDGKVFTRQRQGLVRRRERRGARARLEDERRPRELQRRPQRPAHPRAVPARLRLDVRLRALDRPDLVRARPLPRDRARQADTAVPPRLPLLLVVPYAIPGFLARADLGGPPERRLRRRQQPAAREHPLALRPVVGQGVGDRGQRLADGALLLARSRSARCSRSRASSSRRRAWTAAAAGRSSGG